MIIWCGFTFKFYAYVKPYSKQRCKKMLIRKGLFFRFTCLSWASEQPHVSHKAEFTRLLHNHKKENHCKNGIHSIELYEKSVQAEIPDSFWPEAIKTKGLRLLSKNCKWRKNHWFWQLKKIVQECGWQTRQDNNALQRIIYYVRNFWYVIGFDYLVGHLLV